MSDPNGESVFVDTSSADFLNGAEGGERQQDNGGSEMDIDIMDRFQGIDREAYEKALKSDQGASGDEPAGGDDPAAGSDEPAGGKDPAVGGEVNYKQSYTDWMKRQGVDVDVSKLPEQFGKAEMDKEVALHYASKVVTDPMVLELARMGMSMEAYQKEMAPIKQLLELKPKELYAHREANKALQTEIKLGRVKADDQEAKAKFYSEHSAKVMKEVETLDDAAMENVVADDRAGLKAKLDELPTRLRTQQEAQQKAENERLRQEYDAEQKEMSQRVKEAVAKGENYGIPFASQAERTEFLEYFDKQTKFGDVKVKGADGKEEVVQDFPFLKSLEDPRTMTKVLRVMQLLEKGTLTDIKNGIRKSAVEDLDLEPATTPSRTQNGGNAGGKWADTSKQSYLHGG